MNSHRTCPAGAQSPISDRRHAIIEALARQREAWEMARAATKETALAPSSNDSLIATTSNPTASGPPSISAAAIDSYETTGGARPTTPGHALQLTQAEQEPQQHLEQEQSWLPEFNERWAHDLAFQPCQAEQEAQKCSETQGESLLPEVDEFWAHDLAFQHAYSDEGESEIDTDDPTWIEDHYPSESEAGKVNIDECGQEPEDEGVFEFDAEQLERPFLGLQQQRDIVVEANVTPGMPFPSSLINVSQENVGNPFKTAAPSMASNSNIDTIAATVCLVVITLHFLAGLATSWCVFLLKAFAFLLEALGRPDIAGQIPSRFPTALSYSRVPLYQVTGLPVCPTCRDVYPVGFSCPVDCPRCSIPLYKEPLHPTNCSIPNPTRKALVPRVCLPFLSISGQLEA